MNAATVFVVVFVALWVGHDVGDHWVQSDGDARVKAEVSWRGRWACTRHVATLSVVQAGCLAAAAVVLAVPVPAGRVVAGLVVNAVTHWVVDRRRPLVAVAHVADRVGMAKSAFLALGVPRPGRDDNPSLGTGGYALDQSAHVFCLFLAALVVAA